MRTSILVLSIPLCLFTSSAQGPRAGVKGGLNLSTLYNAKATDQNSVLGLNAGFFGRTRTEESIGLQVELLYSAKGNRTHYEGVFGLVDQTVDLNLNYLSIPALLCFRFAEQTVEIQAGGYAAYLMNANANTEGDLGSGSEELDRDNFNTLDAGLVGGIAFNAGAVQVGARYEYGLVTLANSDNAELLLGDAKNACAQLYVAVGIP
ncbi:MAG: PorT family protein [Flavobacteriales bacterium]|nr:PorT family protein [Flavobacteriales bacterium]